MNIKKNYKKLIASVVLIFTVSFCAMAQDSAKKDLNFSVAYYQVNNQIIYLMVSAKTKVDGKFKPVKDINLNVYLDADSAKNLIAKLTTDNNGLAKAVLPPALKPIWDATANHKFLAISESNKDFDAANAEVSITKSKIILDTITDGDTKTITVKVTAFNGTEWLPVKNVEMKLGVKYLNGNAILSAADEATYTTDSTGTVTTELKKEKLSGNEKGNITLIAKVDDNEQLGNLVIEKITPWGKSVKPNDDFFSQRKLWSTRFRTPWWLLFMAYSIVIGVWGTIIYLIVQLIKIKKLGLKDESQISNG